MRTILHEEQGEKAAEVVSDGLIFRSAQEALELLMNLPDPTVKKLIFRKENLPSDFFVLRTGLAGEILQKIVNYRFQIAIVGDFDGIASESLKAFILESNRSRQVFFVDSVSKAKTLLFKSGL
jgi:hypothetical protein